MKQSTLDHLNDNPVLQQIAQKALPILKEAGVTKSSIFGSFVRGDNKRGSDVDILVKVPRGTGLFGFINLKIKLEKALRKKVDLVSYNSIRHPKLRKIIFSEQVPII